MSSLIYWVFFFIVLIVYFIHLLSSYPCALQHLKSEATLPSDYCFDRCKSRTQFKVRVKKQPPTIVESALTSKPPAAEDMSDTNPFTQDSQWDGFQLVDDEGLPQLGDELNLEDS